jgi:hypothetical protein
LSVSPSLRASTFAEARRARRRGGRLEADPSHHSVKTGENVYRAYAYINFFILRRRAI